MAIRLPYKKQHNTRSAMTAYSKIVTELNHPQALSILIALEDDAATRERIIELATECFSQVDEDTLADILFQRLNAIDVIDLWESSGKGYYGYDDPVDVAYEMLDETVQSSRDEMLKYRRLNMKKQEKICFRAIVRGLLRYGAEGSNEFRDWVSDDPYILADNEIYDWCAEYPEIKMEQLKKRFDTS
jgi:hypothetical protein